MIGQDFFWVHIRIHFTFDYLSPWAVCTHYLVFRRDPSYKGRKLILSVFSGLQHRSTTVFLKVPICTNLILEWVKHITWWQKCRTKHHLSTIWCLQPLKVKPKIRVNVKKIQIQQVHSDTNYHSINNRDVGSPEK